MLIGGEFTSCSGLPRSRVARLLPSGALDTNFVVGLGADKTVYAVARQCDGRILVAGEFSTFNNVSRKLIARLHSDGSLDSSFDPGPNVNVVGAINGLGWQADGKLVVGGPFEWDCNGSVRRRVARVHANGTLDLSFDAGLGTNTTVTALAVQPNNQILLAGTFSRPDGSTNRVLRLHEDGSMDATFQTVPGPDGPVTALLRQPDGWVLIAGSFQSVNGVPRGGLARLLADVWVFDPAPSEQGWTFRVATIAGKTYTLESKEAVDDATWTVRASAFGDGAVQRLTDPAPNPPHRCYRIRME